MSPEAQSPFEQMLTSFAYGAIASTAGDDGGGDGGRSRKKQRARREDAVAERESRSPAAPSTPPRSLRRGVRRSGLPLPNGVSAARDGTRAADSAVRMRRETTEGQAAACISPAAEDMLLRQQHQEVVSSGVSGNPHVQPAGKSGQWSSESSPSCLRRSEEGRSCFPSRFSRCDSSVSTGCKDGHIELREQEGGDGSNEIVATRKRKKKGVSAKDGRCGLAAMADDDEQNRRNQVNGSSKTKKRSRRSTSLQSEKDKTKGDRRKRSRKKKVVVVSPYFASSAEQQQIPEGESGVRNLVEVVVQRRTRRKRASKSTEEDDEEQASIDRHSGHLKPEGGEKRKKKKEKKKKGEPSQLSAAGRMADAYKRVPDDNLWVPPFSDYELLQEFHFFDHWRVLVICMLLNRTTGQKVRKVLPRLFLLCPDAEATIRVPEEEIEELIRPLGLQNKRSKMIKRMSEEYLSSDWTHVTQLHGIGKYAADAYAIFCSGRWKDVKPNDHKLVDYWRFLMDDKDARRSIIVQKPPSAGQPEYTHFFFL